VAISRSDRASLRPRPSIPYAKSSRRRAPHAHSSTPPKEQGAGDSRDPPGPGREMRKTGASGSEKANDIYLISKTGGAHTIRKP
jgi:hypothetical protein